jgi:hypothetical protein
MKRLFLTFCAVVVFLNAFAGSALACACCAEPNTYMIWTGKPETYIQGLLGEMKFDSRATLYMTEAGFDSIVGLNEIQSEYESGSWIAAGGEFDAVAEFTNKTWKFTLKTPSGKTGTLTLPMPVQMVQYKADIHDTDDRGLGVILYKEFRFKGNVQSGAGFLRASIVKPTTYFLVLQGRGNGCDNAEDFTHWHLEINGKKARYEFNGKLTSGTTQESDEDEN